MTTRTPPQSPVAAAIAAEEARAFTLATRVRVIAVSIVAAWLGVEVPLEHVLYLWAFAAGFLVLGIVPWWLRRRGRWHGAVRYLFPALDAALLVAAVLTPNPLDPTPHPAAQRFRFGNEIYFVVLIAFSVFTYSPRLVLWHGIVSALAWGMGGLAVLALPGSFTMVGGDVWLALSPSERVARVADPYFVPLPLWGRPIVVFVVTAGALATFVWRARRLVEREAMSERARANLARYFSANLVDELSRTDAPLATSRRQDCAVLFADVVGFSRLAARQTPEEVIAFLRDYHARMERAVFDHGGTLDKYVGDGVMATFGTPHPVPTAASQALACAHAMQRAIDAWNGARRAAGAEPVRIGIGLHHGPVVLGDIGGPHRFEFAVLGDTVNVASRLERLTRRLGVDLAASDAFVRAVRAAPGAAAVAALLADLERRPAQHLRGLEAPLDVWIRVSGPA